MAASMDIIEIRDIPIAVLNAMFRAICLIKIKVSSKIDVNIPLKIAKDMMAKTGQSIPEN